MPLRRRSKRPRAVRGGDLRLTYFDALIAVGKKDFVKARDLSQQLLKRAPEHVPTLVLIGGIELQEKHYATAESTLQRALMLAPQHTGARILLVRTYLASNQAPRALEVIQPLIAGSVRVAPTTMMLAGETYLANGDIKEAAQYFEAASQSKSQQELARIRLGQIALASGDVDDGIKTLEAATAQDNAPIQAEMALIAGYTRKGRDRQGTSGGPGAGQEAPGQSAGLSDSWGGAGVAQGCLGGSRCLREGARAESALLAGGGGPRATRPCGEQAGRCARPI